MKKVLILIIIGILLVVSFFIVFSMEKSDLDITLQNVPTSVLAKYNELEPQYNYSMGAGISLCTKNDEKIYYVWGSGGFSGITFYYTVSGDEIGSSWTSDTPDYSLPKPSVNIREYNCTIIKKSRDLFSEP